MADQSDTDEDPRQSSLQQQERARGEEERCGEGEEHAHRSSVPAACRDRWVRIVTAVVRGVGGVGQVFAEGRERHQDQPDHDEVDAEVERQRARDLDRVEHGEVELDVAVFEDRATEQQRAAAR